MLVHFDTDTGKPLGFYLSDLHPLIPQDVLPITREQHEELLRNPRTRRIVATDGVVSLEEIAPVVEQPTQDQLLAHLAEARFETEVGGIDFNGVAVGTARESVTMMASALVTVQSWPLFFKSGTGAFVELDEATFRLVADAVARHVQRCFQLESRIAGEILQGDIIDFQTVQTRWETLLGED